MNRRSYRLEEIAHLVQGEFLGEKDFEIFNLASLEQAQSQHISFVNGDKYLAQAESSLAGVYIVNGIIWTLLEGIVIRRVDDLKRSEKRK